MGNELVVLSCQPSFPLRTDASATSIAASKIELVRLNQTTEYFAKPVQSHRIFAIPATNDAAAAAATDATSLLLFLTRTFAQLLQERLDLLRGLGRGRRSNIGLELHGQRQIEHFFVVCALHLKTG